MTRKNQKRSCIALGLAVVLSLAGIGLSVAGSPKPPEKVSYLLFQVDGRTIPITLATPIRTPLEGFSWLDTKAGGFQALNQAGRVPEGTNPQEFSDWEATRARLTASLASATGCDSTGHTCVYSVRGYPVVYGCSGSCGGGGCCVIRVVSTNGAAPLDGPVPPPDVRPREIKK